MAFSTYFRPLASAKMQFDEFEKVMQVVECHFEVIFCFLTNGNFDFFQVDKATIQVAEWQLKVIFCLLTSLKFDFGDVEKSDVSSGHQSVGTHLFHFNQPKMRLG